MKRRKGASTSSVPSLPPVAPSVENSSSLDAPSDQDNTGLKPKPPTGKSKRRKSPRVYKPGLDPEEAQRRRKELYESKRKQKRKDSLNKRRREAKKVSKKRLRPPKYDFRARLKYGESRGFITAGQKQELYSSWMSAKGTGKQLVYEEKLEKIISKKSKKSRGGKRTRKKRRKKKKTRRRRKYRKKTKGRKIRRKKRTRRK